MTFAPERFRDYIGDAMALGLDAPTLAVVVALRFHADDEGRVYRTVEEVAADAGVSTRTALRRLADLAAMKIIERQVESKRGNVYQLRPVQKCQRVTSEVPACHIRSASLSHQKCQPVTSEVPESHIRSDRESHPNHIGSSSGSHVVLVDHVADAGRTPARTHEDTDLAAQKLQGHPAHDTLLPAARVAVAILGVCPEAYTLESWFAQGYSLPRIEYGLRQAKQAALGQFMPLGKIIISAGRWMQRAQPGEYQQGPQRADTGAERAAPISAPPSEARKPLTPEETAAAFAEILA